MIKKYIITILIFIFLTTFIVILLNTINYKKEFFITSINPYPDVRDDNNNILNPYIWYKFDNSTNLGIDNMGMNNLTNYNVTFDTSTNFIRGNGSASFATLGSYLNFNNTIPFHTIQPATGISISFWVRGLSTSVAYSPFFFFGNNSGAGTGNFYIRRAGSGTGLEVGLWAGSYEVVVIPGNFYDGNWKHLTWTISTTGIWSFYVNGTNQNISMTRGFPNRDYTTGIRKIGSNFIGNIDDFRIYSTALPAVKIRKLYDDKILISNQIQEAENARIRAEIEAENARIRAEIEAENARIRAEGRKNAILNSIRESADAYNSELTSQTTSLEITSELQKYPSGILDPSSVSSTPQTLNRNLRFGNQEYEIAFTSFDNQNRNNTPLKLFNGNIDNSAIIDSDNPNSDLIGGSFSSDRDSGYDLTSGNYIGQKRLTINGTQISGEGLYIKAPSAFIIRKYGFVALTGNENYAPGKWMLFGTNATIDPAGNNIQATLIDDATGSQLSRVNYLNKYSWYLKTIPAPVPPTGFTTYLFIFTATARSDLNISDYDYNKLNFSEITIYGHPPATTS